MCLVLSIACDLLFFPLLDFFIFSRFHLEDFFHVGKL